MTRTRQIIFDAQGQAIERRIFILPAKFSKKFDRITKYYNIKPADLIMSMLDLFDDYPKDTLNPPIVLKYNRSKLKRTVIKKVI